jgi:hypothetical protein
MKYIKTFLTNITVGGTWWKRNIWIPSVVDPNIRVVINGYDLSDTTRKRTHHCRGLAPYHLLATHHIGPP